MIKPFIMSQRQGKNNGYYDQYMIMLFGFLLLPITVKITPIINPAIIK